MAGALRPKPASVSRAPPGAGRRCACAALLAGTVALGGCVATDELYAEYDAALCPIVAVRSDEGDTATVRYVERATGEAVPFPPAIYFGYDSDALDGWARLELDAAAALLGRHPELNVLLTGFTSELGSRRYNATLASRRTARVVGYLQDAGIARRRMLSQPIGQGLPEFTGDERVANAVNRRVGLTLLDRAGRPVAPDFAEPELERGRERVGPDWPPADVSENLRAVQPVGPGQGPRFAPVPTPVMAPATTPATTPASGSVGDVR